MADEYQTHWFVDEKSHYLVVLPDIRTKFLRFYSVMHRSPELNMKKEEKRMMRSRYFAQR